MLHIIYAEVSGEKKHISAFTEQGDAVYYFNGLKRKYWFTPDISEVTEKEVPIYMTVMSSDEFQNFIQ